MKDAPSLLTFTDVCRAIASGPRARANGKTYYPARPCGFFSLSNRIRLAWAVFRGDADVLIWPGDEVEMIERGFGIHESSRWQDGER